MSDEVENLVKNSSDGLRQVLLPSRDAKPGAWHPDSLHRSWVYHALHDEKMFDVHAMYVVTETMVNPAVFGLTAKHKPRHDHDEHKVDYFGVRSMETCRTALERMLKERDIRETSWETVTGTTEDRAHLSYPVVHLVFSNQYDAFRKTVEDLTSDVAFKHMVNIEGQWEYDLAILKKMHEEKVNPLKLGKDFRLNGNSIKMIVDLFCPSHIEKYKESSSDD